jgi:hypothetical protein
MADVVYLLIIAAFFGLAALYVRACAAIMGPDEQAAPQRLDESGPEPMAA